MLEIAGEPLAGFVCTEDMRSGKIATHCSYSIAAHAYANRTCKELRNRGMPRSPTDATKACNR
jgi:hypothetical protein